MRLWKKPQESDIFVSNRQNNDLWVKLLSPDTEISQRQNVNEYDLVQDEYMKNLGTTENIKQAYRQTG